MGLFLLDTCDTSMHFNWSACNSSISLEYFIRHSPNRHSSFPFLSFVVINRGQAQLPPQLPGTLSFNSEYAFLPNVTPPMHPLLS